MMLAISSALVIGNYSLPKQDFEGPIAYIETRRLEADNVVTLGLAAEPYVQYYDTGWQVIDTKQGLDEVRAGATRTWLVIAFPNRTTRKFKDVMTAVEESFSMVKNFRGTLGDGSVLVYRSNNTEQ